VNTEPTLGPVRCAGGGDDGNRSIDIAPAVLADGTPAIAVWAGPGQDGEPAFISAADADMASLVLTLAHAAAEAQQTARDLRDLGGLR